MSERLKKVTEQLRRDNEEAESIFLQNELLSKENRRYREALEFYAKERNWEDSWIITMNGQESDVPLAIDDCGYKARKALEGESDD